MIKLSQERNQSLLALHGWSAVFLGLLLYWVLLTGSVAVFADEINAWANPYPETELGELPNEVDALLRPVLDDIPNEEKELVLLRPTTSGLLQLFFEGHPPETEESATAADETKPATPPHNQQMSILLHPQTGEIVKATDLLAQQHGDKLPADYQPAIAEIDTPEANALGALAEFFVAWHVNLHIPAPWGLLLTGILGLAMLLAAITGFLLHRHLIRELFTLRSFKRGLLGERDRHVLAGTWSLPFAFLLAFTGAFFSLAGSFGIPAVAMVSFGGDQERLVRELVGEPDDSDPSPAAFANLDMVIADVADRHGMIVQSLQINHAGRGDAEIIVGTHAPGNHLYGKQFVYGGTSGEFVREKPPLGSEPSAGSVGLSLMAPLHFGNFAGLFSKFLWLALGLASAYIVFNGIKLFTRRRIEQGGWRLLAAVNVGLGFGLPLGMIAVAMVYFATATTSESLETLMMLTLALGLVFSLIVSKVTSLQSASRSLILLNAAGLTLLPLVRWLTGGPGWLAAMEQQLVWVVGMDLLLLFSGILIILTTRRSTRQVDAPLMDNAAEVRA